MHFDKSVRSTITAVKQKPLTKLGQGLGPDHPSQTENFLKNALPHLGAGVKLGKIQTVRDPIIKEPQGWDELDAEGYDPNSVLGACYWRVVRRGDKRFYLSTVAIGMDHLLKIWGTVGLPYYDFDIAAAAIRIETEFGDFSDADRDAMLAEMPPERRELALNAARSRKASTLPNPPKNPLWPYHKSQQEEYLKMAKPCLIFRVVVSDDSSSPSGLSVEIEGATAETVFGWDSIEAEGFDKNGPLGTTYWRTIVRADQRLHVSTFALGEVDFVKTWGMEETKHFDHELGAVPVCVEMEVSEKYPGPIGELAVQMEIWGKEPGHEKLSE